MSPGLADRLQNLVLTENHNEPVVSVFLEAPVGESDLDPAGTV